MTAPGAILVRTTSPPSPSLLWSTRTVTPVNPMGSGSTSVLMTVVSYITKPPILALIPSAEPPLPRPAFAYDKVLYHAQRAGGKDRVRRPLRASRIRSDRLDG